MLLEETIQLFWKDSTSLSSTLPPERFYTGPVLAPMLPCVLLLHEKTEVLQYTNRAEPWQKIYFRFELRHESFEDGMKLAGLIRQSFDRLVLHDPEGKWSFRFQFRQGEDSQEETGKWVFVRRFALTG